MTVFVNDFCGRSIQFSEMFGSTASRGVRLARPRKAAVVLFAVVEAPDFERARSGDDALLPRVIRGEQAAEVVAADRNAYAVRDGERYRQELVVLRVRHRQQVAVLQLHAIRAGRRAALVDAARVRDIGQAALVEVLAYALVLRGPRTEPSADDVLAEVHPPHESELGIEVRLRLDPVDHQTVTIGGVAELRTVAVIAARPARRLRLRDECAEIHVLGKREARVEPPRLIRPAAGRRQRSIREHAADRAAAENVAAHAQHVEVGLQRAGQRTSRGEIVGFDVECADVPGAGLAAQARAGDDRHGARSAQADAAAVEERRGVAAELRRIRAGRRRRTSGGHRRRSERECACTLEEEFALFGEHEVEPRQVHLRFVFLDLREIGVVREIGGKAFGDSVLDVEPGILFELIAHLRRRDSVGGQS